MFRGPSPCGWREGSCRAASSAQRPPWSGASRQVGATAVELPLDITIIPHSSTSPGERDFKPRKLSPPSPCSPSLIKIEGTHVPISHLLEGCCGVYASSLYTGTKFEYHLHLSGRQWILHQTHAHSPPLLLRSKAPSEADQMTFPGNKTSHLYVFTSAWSVPSLDRGPAQLARHSERLLIKLLPAKSGLRVHRRAGSPGGAVQAATSFASVWPQVSEVTEQKCAPAWQPLSEGHPRCRAEGHGAALPDWWSPRAPLVTGGLPGQQPSG